MDDQHKILVGGVVAIALVVGMVTFLSPSTSGAVMYNPSVYPSVAPNSVYLDYSAFECDLTERPLLRHETRYGTGKMTIVGCVSRDEAIVAPGNRFPSTKQRWKIPPR